MPDSPHARRLVFSPSFHRSPKLDTTTGLLAVGREANGSSSCQSNPRGSRSLIDGTAQGGFGVPLPIEQGEPPEKVDAVGGMKRDGWMGRSQLTRSAFKRPQFAQIHSRIFLTLVKKPVPED